MCRHQPAWAIGTKVRLNGFRVRQRPPIRHSREGGSADSHLKCNTWFQKVQREYCSRGARGIVVSLHQLSKPIVRQGGQVGLARQGAAQATDGVLDATLLPRRAGIAEEGLEAEGMELVMLGELGAVVESNGLTPQQRMEDMELAIG